MTALLAACWLAAIAWAAVLAPWAAWAAAWEEAAAAAPAPIAPVERPAAAFPVIDGLIEVGRVAAIVGELNSQIPTELKTNMPTVKPSKRERIMIIRNLPILPL